MHMIKTHCIHCVLVQDFVSGRACCVNQYHCKSLLMSLTSPSLINILSLKCFAGKDLPIISHLRLCLLCDIAMKNQFSHNQSTIVYIYIYIYTHLKIKPNSVRIRFLSCQIFVLPSTGFELTPLIHCSTNCLALCPVPSTTSAIYEDNDIDIFL
jgi:hypothetical protein